jgi:hypothetical protein
MSSSDDYPIGYKKPPKATQFKKGTSGNKSGRPKKKPEFHYKRIFMEELCKVVTVPVNGKSMKLSMVELIIKDLINKCLKGDKYAQKTVLAFINTHNDEFPPLVQISEEVMKFKARILEKAKQIADQYKKPSGDEEDDES